MEFEIKNVTGRWQGRPRTLKRMIVGWFVDADIGNEGGTSGNDLCFVSPSGGSAYPNLAAQYQLAQEMGWSDPPPYLEGFKLVTGQVNNTSDTIHVRSQPTIGYPEYDHDILPGQPIGMTAFQFFTINIDLSTPGECYLELSGRYYPVPDTLNSYQRDTYGPSDKRFLMACGPFDLPNDSTAKFVLYIIAAVDSTNLMYKAGLVGVESPPSPIARNAPGPVRYSSVPDPFTSFAKVPGHASERFALYDISGRRVGVYKGDRIGEELAAGVYFIRSLDSKDKPSRIVKVR